MIILKIDYLLNWKNLKYFFILILHCSVVLFVNFCFILSKTHSIALIDLVLHLLLHLLLLTKQPNFWDFVQSEVPYFLSICRLRYEHLLVISEDILFIALYLILIQVIFHLNIVVILFGFSYVVEFQEDKRFLHEEPKH